MVLRFFVFVSCLVLLSSLNLLLVGCTGNIVRPVAVSNQTYESIGPQGQLSQKSIEEIEERYPDGFWKKYGLQTPHVILSERKNVAVRPFSAQTTEKELALSVTETFRSALVQSQSFTVVERDNLEHVFSEFKLNQSGFTDQEGAAEPGELKNVSFIVTGSIRQHKGMLLEAHATDLRTGALLASEQISSPTITVENAQGLAKIFTHSFYNAVYAEKDK